jgi:hypothetical protein
LQGDGTVTGTPAPHPLPKFRSEPSDQGITRSAESLRTGIPTSISRYDVTIELARVDEGILDYEFSDEASRSPRGMRSGIGWRPLAELATFARSVNEQFIFRKVWSTPAFVDT